MPAANKIKQVQRPPAGAPLVGTYANAAGYLRKRYKLGPRRYAETYAHREAAGTPKGQQADHRDGNKANNTRANLQNLTPSRHATVGNLRRRLRARGGQR